MDLPPAILVLPRMVVVLSCPTCGFLGTHGCTLAPSSVSSSFFAGGLVSVESFQVLCVRSYREDAWFHTLVLVGSGVRLVADMLGVTDWCLAVGNAVRLRSCGSRLRLGRRLSRCIGRNLFRDGPWVFHKSCWHTPDKDKRWNSCAFGISTFASFPPEPWQPTPSYAKPNK